MGLRIAGRGIYAHSSACLRPFHDRFWRSERVPEAPSLKAALLWLPVVKRLLSV
jgi:hypothetical protein